MAEANSGGVGGISIHAVDVAQGIPAKGLSVRLRRSETELVNIAAGHCTEDGHFHHPINSGNGVTRGIHVVEFDVGSYYRNINYDIPDPAFLEVAVFHFGIDKVDEHFHLPFKFTPWGFSLFRGGA